LTTSDNLRDADSRRTKRARGWLRTWVGNLLNSCSFAVLEAGYCWLVGDCQCRCYLGGWVLNSEPEIMKCQTDSVGLLYSNKAL